MPELLVEMLPAPGTAWQGITEDLREDEGVTIKRGRPAEAATADPGEMTLKLNNRHGKYSPDNPMSPYYGRIGRNTPIGVWVRGEDTYVRPTGPDGRATVASSEDLDITEDLDVAVEVALFNLPTQLGSTYAAAVQELAGRYNVTDGEQSWALLITEFGHLQLRWSTDGVDLITANSTVPLPVRPEERAAVRATLDVDDGSGGHVVTFFIAPGLGGPWRRLGDPIVRSGATTIHNPTTAVPLEVGGVTGGLSFPTPLGLFHGFELRQGIGGDLVAEFGAEPIPYGATGWTDTVGNTWSLAGPCLVRNWYPRFIGEVLAWPARWDTSGADRWVTIAAHGPLRRLGQGRKALESTLRRRIPSATPAPLAYWPMEDGRDASAAYSPLEGVAPLRLDGVTWAADDTLGGASPLPTLGQRVSLYGAVPGAQPGGWQAEMVYRLDEMPAAEQTMLRLELTGASGGVTAVRVRISTAGIRVQALDQDGAVVAFSLFTDADAIAAVTGSWNRLIAFSHQSGTDCRVRFAWRNIATNTFWFSGTLWTGTTVGRVTAVRGEWQADFQGAAIGHLGVWDIGGTGTSTPGISVYGGADDGFTGESAPGRLRRIAQEQRQRVTVPASTTGQRLGPQPIAPYLSILKDLAAADGGVLYELRGTPDALHYLPQTALYDRQPAVVLDYAAGEVAPPLTPEPGDLDTRNDVTVSRPGGSSARAVLEEGPLSVQDPPTGVGQYDEAISVNVHRDGQLDGIAWWRLHLGTWGGTRIPSAVINLANPRAAGLRQEVLDGLDVGAALRIINPPPDLPPGNVDLATDSYEEHIDLVRWIITASCSPLGPWQVGRVAEDDRADDDPDAAVHVDTDGCELYAPLAADDTGAMLWTHTGHVWATTADAGGGTAAPGDFPLDLTVGGEVVQATGVQPLAWDDYDRTTTGTWGQLPTGQTWAEGGGPASDRSVTGGAGRLTLSAPTTTSRIQLVALYPADCELFAAVSVDQMATGGTLSAQLVARYTGPSDYYAGRLHWTTGSNLFVSIARGATQIDANADSGYDYAPGDVIGMRMRAVGDRVRLRVWPMARLEPGGWTIDRTVTTGPIASGYVGLIGAGFSGNTNVSPTIDVSAFEITNPQWAALDRSVNGVVKDHDDGTDIHLAHPMIAAH